jgi:hypothetical protein
MAGTKNNKKSMAVWQQQAPLEPLECNTTTAGAMYDVLRNATCHGETIWVV